MIALLFVLAAGPAVDASVFAGSTLRRLYFRDRLTPTLAGWQSGAMAVAGISLQAYPATGKLPVLDDVGVYGSFARSLKSQTLTADGELAFNTQETTWEMGLRWRAERGALSIGYGSLKHDFTGARLPGFLLPAGTVQYWRPGVEGRTGLGRVVLRGGLGYLLVVRQDFLSANFPRASKGGVDVFARASMDVWKKVVLTFSARYSRFFYSLHPQPYDPYIAGGALDEVFAVDLACGYRL
ncbi:MAG: hypothetical protein E6J88_02110 [Deltaproteobacteria bacterium]|nr:MAG: hypothetical protein E6J88_02110 [Deltaproteobacteria bacterium]